MRAANSARTWAFRSIAMRVSYQYDWVTFWHNNMLWRTFFIEYPALRSVLQIVEIDTDFPVWNSRSRRSSSRYKSGVASIVRRRCCKMPLGSCQAYRVMKTHLNVIVTKTWICVRFLASINLDTAILVESRYHVVDFALADTCVHGYIFPWHYCAQTNNDPLDLFRYRFSHTCWDSRRRCCWSFVVVTSTWLSRSDHVHWMYGVRWGQIFRLPKNGCIFKTNLLV
jgi:hypothetical protein